MPLTASFESNIKKVRRALTPANRNLLDRMRMLINDNGEANLAEVLDNLYPGERPAQAIKKYANFLGEGINAEFLHSVRRVNTQEDFFALCKEHLDHNQGMTLAPAPDTSGQKP